MAAYDAEIAQCQQQIRDLIAKREQIDQEISGRQLVLAGFLALQMTPGLSSGKITIGHLMRRISPTLVEGLADQCRRIVRSAQGDPLTPTEVKQRLEKIGFDFSGYKTNPLSSVHTTLKRMVDGKEFHAVRIRGQGVAYKWVRPNV